MQTFAAPSGNDLAKCAAITGELARLECYDGLSKTFKLSPQPLLPKPSEESGKWKSYSKTNPIDDSTTVIVSLEADTGTNDRGEKTSLVIRCKSNETDLLVNWDDYLGRDAYVLSRVGNNKAKTQTWSITTDSKGAFHPSPIAFIKELLTADKLVTQITPYNESPVTSVFSTAGLSNAIKPIRDTCKW